MAESGIGTSRGDRAVAILVAPIVLGWDLARSLFFLLCRLMDKLDPFAAMGALLGRLAPTVARVMRALLARTLPFRLRLTELGAVVYGWILTAVRPLVRVMTPAVERAGRVLAAAVRSVVARIRRSAATVRRLSGPTLRRAHRILGQAFEWSVAPTRRAATLVRNAYSRGISTR